MCGNGNKKQDGLSLPISSSSSYSPPWIWFGYGVCVGEGGVSCDIGE